MYSRYAKLRDNKGLTDAEVSKITGIPQPTLSDWKSRCAEYEKNKRGKKIPSLSVDSLKKIATLLGTTVDEIIG